MRQMKKKIIIAILVTLLLTAAVAFAIGSIINVYLYKGISVTRVADFLAFLTLKRISKVQGLSEVFKVKTGVGIVTLAPFVTAK